MRAPSGGKRIRFFEDHIELGPVSISNAFVVRLRAVDNLLHVAYLVSDGTTVEEYFRYEARTRGRATKILQSAVVRALELRAAYPPVAAQPVPAQPVVKAVVEPPGAARDGRTTVQIRDPEVIFSPICPHCGAEASSVDLFHASRGLAHRAAWIVPVCEAHPRLGDAIRIARWSATVSGASFIYVSFLSTSKVHKVAPGARRKIQGIPYTVFSSVLGWWSFAGPFFTVRAIRTNLRGAST
ncbi:MAG TPA: hypothetical protein VGV61_12535 [Thermoanaerobaculia bacterium]|nr:hypothetical protein [Thermoanaerobaculia bacterium]